MLVRISLFFALALPAVMGFLPAPTCTSPTALEAISRREWVQTCGVAAAAAPFFSPLPAFAAKNRAAPANVPAPPPDPFKEFKASEKDYTKNQAVSKLGDKTVKEVKVGGAKKPKPKPQSMADIRAAEAAAKAEAAAAPKKRRGGKK
mmetsp:Transcript_1838/g.4047  ORF Transcript_1838/g.4047 Transcript_1838/m.4047 type:complete len:147 (+) Transcript_1838:32-472(+)